MTPQPLFQLPVPTTADEAEDLGVQIALTCGLAAHRTPRGADGGLDLIGPTVAGQVKHTATPVSRPTMQRFAGAQHQHRIFVSRSGYSAPAVLYANEHRIALFSYDETGSVYGCNAEAQHLATGKPPRNKALTAQQRRAVALRLAEEVKHTIALHLRTNIGWSTRRRLRKAIQALRAAEAADAKWQLRQRRKPGRHKTREEVLINEIERQITTAARLTRTPR